MKSKKSRYSKKITTVDEYIAQFPKGIAAKLHAIRKLIKVSAPGAEESISYGMPLFKLNGRLVYFAAFPKHIGFYPFPSAIKAFKKDLSPYKTLPGTVQFSPDKPLPLPLIRKIVKFRIKENLAKKKKK